MKSLFNKLLLINQSGHNPKPKPNKAELVFYMKRPNLKAFAPNKLITGTFEQSTSKTKYVEEWLTKSVKGQSLKLMMGSP